MSMKTLQMLDDTVLPLANWVLELLDDSHSLEVAGMGCNLHNIIAFQKQSAKPFNAKLKRIFRAILLLLMMYQP